MERTPQWLPPRPVAEPVAQPQAPPPTPPAPRGHSTLRRAIGPLIVAIALLAGKLKFVLVALKGAKFLTTSASALVSVAAYALIWGWPFAAGFVALLFVHEMGHYVQLRREGVKPTGMVFIPFLGAAVGARSLGGNALAEARVGLAGPILGTLGTVLVAVAGFALESDALKALAYIGFLLNLFNLLPVVPLDGGRAMAAMAPWMWFVGLGAVITGMFLWPNPILVLIAIVGAFDVYRRWSRRKKGEDGNAAYYAVRPKARLLVGAVYVGLVVALALGMDFTYVERDFSDV